MPRKKLIEVALPLEAINRESAREKSIRHGHPSTFHYWPARRPLSTCRAVLFAQLVDDPADREAPQAFHDAIDRLRNQLPLERNLRHDSGTDARRAWLFDFLAELVRWENSTNRPMLDAANELISACAGPEGPPAIADPFCGGGTFPLEAQRLGLRAYASDLNPVAVLVTKAMIEIPQPFAGLPPVHPDARNAHSKGGKKKGQKSLMDAVTAPADAPFAGLAADVRAYGEWMREHAWERLKHLYPPVVAFFDVEAKRWYGEDEVCEEGARFFAIEAEGINRQPLERHELTAIAWIWARTVPSPNPALRGAPVPVVRSFRLGTKLGRGVWIEPLVERTNSIIRYRIVHEADGKSYEVAPRGTLGAGHDRCILSGTPLTHEYVRSQASLGRLGTQLMAIACESPKGHPKGRVYLPPSRREVETASSAMPAWIPDTPLPNDAMDLRVQGYGVKKWSDLFLPRQASALSEFSDLVKEVKADVLERCASLSDRDGTAYAKAVATYCALGVSKLVDRGSLVASWDSSPKMEGIRGSISDNKLQMTFDCAEGNVFSGSSGSWTNTFDYVAPVLLQTPKGPASVEQCAAQQASCYKVGTLIATDPPYYSNIQYADLSDFFYVWLRRSLRAEYPELLRSQVAPKDEQLVANSLRAGGAAQAKRFFESGMGDVMKIIKASTTPEYPCTLVYAYKQQDEAGISGQDGHTTLARPSTGWETFLQGLVDSGLQVTATWPMRTEMGNRKRAQDSNALASSVVLACRPRPAEAPVANPAELKRALARELPKGLQDVISGGLPPVDLFQAAVGLGMAVYSRYARVEGADGKPMRVGGALRLIDAAVKDALEEGDEEMDDATRWAVRWFATYGYDERPYGDAENLALTTNLSVERVKETGILHNPGGRVRLLRPDELREDDDPADDPRPTLWEAAVFLARRLKTGGDESAARLLRRYRDLSGTVNADGAQALAYRLYVLADKAGRGADGTLFDDLARNWPAIEALADTELGVWQPSVPQPQPELPM